MTGHRPRIVLAKPGLDGHDRGIKVVGMALRDAGAEVVYLGLHQSAAQVASVAVMESADVIGLSVLSGVHLSATEQLVAACRAAGIPDVQIVVGGTIPPTDVPKLRAAGASGVFPVGTPLQDLVDEVLQLAAVQPDAPQPEGDA
jgi:methylmalonyl-CoA mutase C-terminal domain/subunit